MFTVKEVSNIFNISVRTIHYYHRIGLLVPTKINSKQYRFYDDLAVEKLKQILIFKEIGLSLNEIKKIFENEYVNVYSLIKMGMDVLLLKKEKIDNSISLIKKLIKEESINENDTYNNLDIKIKEIKDSILESIQ